MNPIILAYFLWSNKSTSHFDNKAAPTNMAIIHHIAFQQIDNVIIVYSSIACLKSSIKQPSYEKTLLDRNSTAF